MEGESRVRKLGEIPDFFSGAYNGLELSKAFWQALKARGVEFKSYSFSDMRVEWDLAFGYEGMEFMGYAGTEFEFWRKEIPFSEGYNYNMAHYDPLTLETALYQVFCALDGKKIDRGHVIGETAIRWVYF